MNLNELAEDLALQLEGMNDVAHRCETIKTWLLAKREEVTEMYEEENQPIVVNPPAPNGVSVGDYVFASRWGDCDPGDPWAVGYVSEVGPNWVVVGNVSQRRYSKVMRITEEQGRRIAERYPSMESGYKSFQYKEIAKIFGVEASS